jgi:2-polyprenyl-3-methyl-5-hydroxy-6-metoxy-1,4-benzoquinol methylase
LFEHVLIIPGEKVLDFGAGGGRVAIPLAKRCEVKVLEVHPDRLRHLKRIGFSEAEDGEQFDVAVAFFVLQHQSLATVRELTAMLSRRAERLIFTYPTYELLEERPKSKLKWVPLAEFVQRPVPDCNHESALCHEEELPMLFEGSDFDVTTLRYVRLSHLGYERLREISRTQR